MEKARVAIQFALYLSLRIASFGLLLSLLYILLGLIVWVY
jgi:hypothetical protein